MVAFTVDSREKSAYYALQYGGVHYHFCHRHARSSSLLLYASLPNIGTAVYVKLSEAQRKGVWLGPVPSHSALLSRFCMGCAFPGLARQSTRDE